MICRSAISLLIDPLGDQCRFAKTGRSGDESEFVTKLHSLVEPIEQLGAGDQVRPEWGDIQFGLK